MTESMLGERQRDSDVATAPTGDVRRSPDSLADVLERVLDKGIVIVGDIEVRLLDIELLTIKLRLLVASVERAREMGIHWWENDEFATGDLTSEDEKAELEERVAALETRLKELPEGAEPRADDARRSSAAEQEQTGERARG